MKRPQAELNSHVVSCFRFSEIVGELAIGQGVDKRQRDWAPNSHLKLII